MDRWCSDAFVLREVSAAKTTTTVDYKRGADVNRLRNDVFVLRVLRCLTFELTGILRWAGFGLGFFSPNLDCRKMSG